MVFSNQTNILGIDQSTQCTGWCHICGNGEINDYGIIKSPNGKTGLDAAYYQTKAIEELVAVRSITLVAAEDIYLPTAKSKSNPKTTFLLGSLKGMIYYMCRERGVDFRLVTSNQICQHLGISPFTARDQKKRASRMIAALDLWGDRSRYLEISDDVADAIAISLIAQRTIDHV